ncbi:MAG: hypothetical protein JW740_01735 [Candidatus Zambryskibacteria bacterium]|nr:hypothetical protein [Candidatus Zambryskibacteria bacterium]
MNKLKSEGLKIFLLFGRVCADNRLFLKKISQSDLDMIESLIRKNKVPMIPFLLKCFPEAFKDYCLTCVKKGIGPDFYPQSVLHYWCNHHHGETPVVFALVCMVENDGRVSVSYNGEVMKVINPYGVTVKKWDLVIIHGPVLIMKASLYGATLR